MYGFYRLAVAVPKLALADPAVNRARLAELCQAAAKNQAAIVVFPELSLTGYTCGDLFYQNTLLKKAWDETVNLAASLSDLPLAAVVGLPVRYSNRLYNMAATLYQGKIAALTPKTFLPNHREFYEQRQFVSGKALFGRTIQPDFAAEAVPVTALLDFGHGLLAGIELCEDLWTPQPPSSLLALQGATVLLNLSASNALVAKSQYRRNLVAQQSARCMAAYMYSSAGVFESTTDTVFGGHAMIAENGAILAENHRFEREANLTYADVDVEKLQALRLSEGTFPEVEPVSPLTLGTLKQLSGMQKLLRPIAAQPFVPVDLEHRAEVCQEIFNIQAAGLARRLESSRSQKALIGISGGLDSTLALLVTVEAFKLLKRDCKDIVAVTMPGFGTTGRTLGNSEKLMKLEKVDLRKIDIQKACLQHFADIGHDPADLSVVYENVQARERTQILMDIANREHGLVVGTGDLSEIALGWSTYNADHMSMYAVNCGVPKTLVRHLVQFCADLAGGELQAVLTDIIDTPVSPELLPADKNGKIAQKTESILGAYELHDFYLYHWVKYGAGAGKILFLAKQAFADKYTEAELKRTLKLFFQRFFSQQFKRSCIPDGPKIGGIALSPRADWRMPSDAEATMWLKELE